MFARPFVPRAEVLPHCAVVVGSGQPTTVLGALAHRLPLVLLAHGSGTEETAEASARAGIARIGTQSSITAPELRDLIADTIDSATMRVAIGAVADELAQLGGRRRAAHIITELARSRQGRPGSHRAAQPSADGSP